MSRSTKWLRKNAISFSPLISPPLSEKSRKPAAVCSARMTPIWAHPRRAAAKGKSDARVGGPKGTAWDEAKVIFQG